MDTKLEHSKPIETSCAALCTDISHGRRDINGLSLLSWKLNKEF
jgi:hypothetical protein